MDEEIKEEMIQEEEKVVVKEETAEDKILELEIEIEDLKEKLASTFDIEEKGIFDAKIQQLEKEIQNIKYPPLEKKITINKEAPSRADHKNGRPKRMVKNAIRIRIV